MRTWRGLSLFSGIGGLDLAFEWAGGEVSAMCEIEPYCQKVLRKHWPHVPIFENIRELNGTDVGAVDVIYGGLYCAPVSPSAWQEPREGKATPVIYGRAGQKFSRVVSEIRPRWIVAENVPGILSLAADDVCSDLERQGYTVGIWNFEAACVGAKHRRERIFLWRTPDAHCDRGASSRGRYKMKLKKGLPISLNNQVAHLLPTPTKFDATCGDLKGKIMPTPVANDAKNNGNPSRYNRHTLSLDAVAGGSLNPEFVEWLMGFPIGWTDLEL